MNPRETVRPPQPRQELEKSKKPDFVETIGRTKKVGIVLDGTWRVGWDQPTGQADTNTVWQFHEDYKSVLRQNGRVIRSLIGTPLLEDQIEEESEIKDPNFGPSLVQVNTLIIPGENERARNLSKRIERIASLMQVNRINASEAKEALAEIRSEFGRVRNANKVAAKDKLGVLMDPNVPLELGTVLGVSDEMLKRAAEGTSMASSLFTRGAEILDWAKLQETRLGPLKFTIEQALRSASGETIKPETRSEWERVFYSDESDLFTALEEIHGRPYSLLKDDKRIQRLRNAANIVLNGPQAQAQRVLGEAYEPFYNLWKQREDRNASAEYKMYQPQGKK